MFESTVALTSTIPHSTSLSLGGGHGPSTAVLKASPQTIAIVASVCVAVMLIIAVTGCLLQKSRGGLLPQRGCEMRMDGADEGKEERSRRKL